MFQILRETAKILFLLGFTLLAIPSFSQDKNIEDVQKSANTLFEQGKYSEAKDLYSQLVSLYPKDENFNYRFGACLLFVDVDKTYPLKFLEYAVSKPNVDVDAFYFLGKGYHYNYRFDEAIQYLKKYKEKREAKDTRYPVDNDIRYCENGKSLMVNITNPLVISKKKVNVADFFTSFKLSEMGGRMLYAPKELHSSVDKKNSYVPIMYKNANSNVIYYSSYGITDKYGLDIYQVTVSDNGILGKPVRLSEKINTVFDERFPFLSEDKSTFYFSSTGHNSMGGADIFQTSFDTLTNSFGLPRNLDYSVNTPDDDLMYAEVGSGGIAFFASTRNCEKGKAYVYKINAKRKAYQIAVLAGSFDAKDTKSCKITVEDLDDHVVVGSFNTNKNSGDYVMRLKNGGRYSFLVEPFGGEVAYQGRVELPNQSEIKLLKQEIQIVEENGVERLIIRNLFEEESQPDDLKIIAQVFVQNADIVEETQPNITLNNEEITQEILAVKKIQEIELEVLVNKKNASFFIANEKRELAHKDLELADQLEKQISVNDASETNRSAQREFAELVKDAKIHLNESKAAYDIGLKYEGETSKAQTSITKADGYLTRVNQAKKEGGRAKVVDLYSEFNNELSPIKAKDISIELERSINQEKMAMKRAIKKTEQIEIEQESLKKQISSQKSASKATKKKKEKAEIATIISALETDLAPLEEEKAKYLLAASSHVKQVSSLENEKQILADLSSNMESSGEVSNDQKMAMLASIKATDAEIVALESVIKQVDMIDSGANTDELVLNETVASKQNLEEELEVSTQAISEVGIENEGIVLNTPVVAVELPVNAVIEDGPEVNAVIADMSDPKMEESVKVESPLFDSSPEYEVTAEQVILVEGQSIPLNITSNTGKRQYSKAELKSAKIVLDKAAYNTLYQDEFKETKGLEDKSDKARETQRINYNWVVAIEKEVAELKYAKEQNTNSSYSENISFKIEDLNAQATQKRNFMALNARIIKQLEEEVLEADQSVNSLSSNEETDTKVGLNELDTELASTNSVVESIGNEEGSDLSNQGITESVDVSVPVTSDTSQFIIPKVTNESASNIQVTGVDQESITSETVLEESNSLGNSAPSAAVASELAFETSNIDASNEALEGEQASTELAENGPSSNEALEGEQVSTELAENGPSSNEALEGEQASTELAENGSSSNEALEGEQASTELAENGPSSNAAVEGEQASTELAENGSSSNAAVEGEQVSNELTENGPSSNAALEGEQASTELAENGSSSNAALEGEQVSTELAENGSSSNAALEDEQVSTELPENGLSTNEAAEGEQAVSENIEINQNSSSLMQVQINPSALVIAEVDMEKGKETKSLTTTENNISAKRTELGNTRKKKQKRILEAEIVNLESDKNFTAKRLALLDTKYDDIELAQSAMISDPLSMRPSQAKYMEARKLKSKTADLQVELEELQISLNGTKKKKKRRVIEAEIVNVQRDLDLVKLESNMTTQSVLEMEEVEAATLKALTPYGKEVMVPIPLLTTQLNAEQYNEIKTKQSFQDYIAVKKESDKQIVSASVLYNSAKQKQVEVAKIEAQISLMEEGIVLLPQNEQESLTKEVVVKRAEQKRLILQADVQYKEAKTLENEAYFNLNEANSELLILDDVADRNMIFMALSGAIEQNVIAYDSANIDAIPLDLTTDIFIDTDSSYYDESKPIPVGVTLPKGVVLKVQIGAFRNPINPTAFRGFAPIVGEKTESGLTRYTAGLFKDFEKANSAKNGIRAKGYSDAFVVAYLDGKRISISEARKVLAGEINASEVVLIDGNSGTSSPEDARTSVTRVDSKPLLPGDGNVKVVDVINRGILFFTVQVGVYNDKIQPGSVFTITPLNSEKIANNLVRYSSGVYGSIVQANQARNAILQMGISDAFVTAYNKGSRVSLSEARTLMSLNENSNVVIPTTPVEPDVAGSSVGVNSTYFIKVGPYQGGIPVEQAREILMLNSLGVVVEKNNNATLYKIGNFTDRQEAEAIKVDLVSKGFSNPTVVKNE
ncbi:MAG: hypothetical protein ACJA2N_000447 [Salibacteraceae bacterium]|jgi:hypothetical protein